jgi:hypothetical protein
MYSLGSSLRRSISAMQKGRSGLEEAVVADRDRERDKTELPAGADGNTWLPHRVTINAKLNHSTAVGAFCRS